MKKQLLFLSLVVLFISPLFVSANTYGDVKFNNPKEGENKLQEIVAGQKYVLEWENIIQADWQISLHEYDGSPSADDISSGPPNYAGQRIEVLGSVSSEENELTVTIPSYLDEGYYYFNFGGKAAYDNSPVIRVVNNVYASISSISDSPSPFIDGKAYNTEKVNFSISDGVAKTLYDSGSINVDDDGWFHKINTDLRKGNYEIILYSNDVELDRRNFELTTETVTYPKNMKLSVVPDEVEEGNDITIYFNDVGAEYYIVSASCKNGITVSGKARPDLCMEGEKIYPTGKDRLNVDGYYPSAERDTSFILEVTAFSKGKVISEDSESVEIEAIQSDKEIDNVSIKVGDALYKNESNRITWGGGQDVVKIGIKAENGNLGWISTDEESDGHLYWDTKEVCSLDMNTCWKTEQVVGDSDGFRIIAVSKDKDGNFIASKDGNYDESSYFHVGKGESVDKEIEENKKGDLSKEEILSLIANLFGKNSDIYKVVELLIQLKIIE